MGTLVTFACGLLLLALATAGHFFVKSSRPVPGAVLWFLLLLVAVLLEFWLTGLVYSVLAWTVGGALVMVMWNSSQSKTV